MSADKTTPKIGAVIDETAQRDAIHIAVAPVVATQILRAGDHVGLVAGTVNEVAGAGPSIPSLGIVDPFLRQYVQVGERFYLFLYPQTITSLRHDWTHPAFYQTPGPAPPTRPDKLASEAWLRAFVARSDCPSYESVVAAAVGDGAEQRDHDYMHFNGSDVHGEIPPEFWDHIEVVTGRTIPRNKRASWFSCSC